MSTAELFARANKIVDALNLTLEETAVLIELGNATEIRVKVGEYETMGMVYDTFPDGDSRTIMVLKFKIDQLRQKSRTNV